MTVHPTAILHTILDWLRAGYPEGVPQEDYVALLAVLRHKLTDDEVRHVVAEVTRDRSRGDAIEQDEIGDAIARLAHEHPGDEDVARVRGRLAAGGWPLADPAQV